MIKKIIFSFALSMIFVVQTSLAQSVFSGKNLVIVGAGSLGYQADTNGRGVNKLGLNVMPMIRISDKFFMVSEIEIGIADGGGGADFGLEQVQMCYKLLPDMTVYAGRFLPKFGAYRGRHGEGFINRLPVDPVGFGDGGIGPMVEMGAGIVGGLQVGYSKLSYDLYVSNGPQLNYPNSVSNDSRWGQMQYEMFTNNNKSQAVGGRIGFLPLSNSSLELGVSGQYKNATGDTGYTNVSVLFYAVDLSYFKKIDAIGSTVRLLGEYKVMQTGNGGNYSAFYLDSTHSQSVSMSSNAWYAQLSIRPTQVENDILKNFEITGRFSQFTPPTGTATFVPGGLWEVDKDVISQFAFGVNYWLRWDAVLKLSYTNQDGNYTANNSLAGQRFNAQIIYRF